MSVTIQGEPARLHAFLGAAHMASYDISPASGHCGTYELINTANRMHDSTLLTVVCCVGPTY